MDLPRPKYQQWIEMSEIIEEEKVIRGHWRNDYSTWTRRNQFIYTIIIFSKENEGQNFENVCFIVAQFIIFNVQSRSFRLFRCWQNYVIISIRMQKNPYFPTAASTKNFWKFAKWIGICQVKSVLVVYHSGWWPSSEDSTRLRCAFGSSSKQIA